MYVCMCCMYICMYICMSTCMFVCLSGCLAERMMYSTPDGQLTRLSSSVLQPTRAYTLLHVRTLQGWSEGEGIRVFTSKSAQQPQRPQHPAAKAFGHGQPRRAEQAGLEKLSKSK